MTPFVAFTAFAVAVVVSLLLTPVAIHIAHRVNAVDRPDGNRKNHARPVALLGGVAVAATTFIVVATFLWLAPGVVEVSRQSILPDLFFAAIVLIIVGLIDDIRGMTGIYKLVGQVMAVSVLIAGGMYFKEVSIFGWSIALGNLSVPFTMFFCLGAINAFNLIDGADGLASSVGAVVCLTLGAIAGMLGDTVAALCCLAFAGGLTGFLRYNAPPARIYLGDTGSMLIGLVVASVAIHSTIKEQAAIALIVPVAICAIPILDAAAAMVRRVTTGQSVFTADRGHLHHSLLLKGLSVGGTVAVITALTVVTCMGALASYYTKHDSFALLAAAGVFISLASAKIFGHAEAQLLATHLRGVIGASLLNRISSSDAATEKAVTLQGKRRWQRIWLGLREAAPVYNVVALKLTVNIPRLHESFYAAWKRQDYDSSQDAWQVSVPLMWGEQRIGKVVLTGATCGKKAVLEMQQVLDFLEPLESEIERFLEGEETVASQLPPSAVANPAPDSLPDQPGHSPTLTVSE